MLLSFVALLTGLTFLYPQKSNAQQVNPVSWEFSVEKTDASHARLIMHASIENHWHLYTINMDE